MNQIHIIDIIIEYMQIIKGQFGILYFDVKRNKIIEAKVTSDSIMINIFISFKKIEYTREILEKI